MVNERVPARPAGHTDKDPKSPPQNTDNHPEFGKPSPLGANRTNRNANPFVIPKANKPRVEHHRPPVQHGIPHKNPTSAPTAEPQSNFSGKSFQEMNPLHPMKPTAYNTHKPRPIDLTENDDDVVEIMRPTNTTWTSRPAPPQMFSSKAPAAKKSSAPSTLQKFMDLTMDVDMGLQREEFGAMDTYSFVDAGKASENIKALLEGAFEDEEDKPRTRARKKKLVDQQIDDLAAKMGAVNVDDNKKDGSKHEADEDEDEEDDGYVEGLNVKLLPHQIDGVAWMKDKETGLKKTRGVHPKGGILADDMGLGKTIQSIALMLSSQRPSQEAIESENAQKKNKPKLSPNVGKGTLIIAPLALIKQWESEIESRVEPSHRMSVCVYHGASRTKHTEDLKKHDVVITTYGTLSSEHNQTTKGGVNAGCYGVHWFRIILDEAHTIKNRNAKSTQAAYALNSEYRWCLTGTPMQNNLDELQSLIKFLRIKPYEDLGAWRDQITRPMSNGRGGLAIRRLQVYLKAFMKRRTKDVLKSDEGLKKSSEKTEGDEKPSNSFQITKRDVLKVEAQFTPAEREFYKRLEQRTDKSLERMMGGDKLSYASALVLLLRLRQACNHPDLVKGDLAQEKDVLTGNIGGSQQKNSAGDDVDNVADLLGGLTVVTKRCDVCQIELNQKDAMDGASRCAECEADLEEDVVKPPKKSKKHKKKSKRRSEEKEDSHEVSETQRARGRRNRPVVLDSDDEEEEAEWLVPEEQRSNTDLGKAGGTDDEDAEGGGQWLNSEDSETEEDKSEYESEDEDEASDEDKQGFTVSQKKKDVIASTKVRHLMKILKKEAPDFKFIVFSFFTSMLDKIEPFLQNANIGYVRYDGAMKNDLRESSLQSLRNSKSTRVLLCSLRAGSLGLNLTAASRVVILEPFWNPVCYLVVLNFAVLTCIC